MNILELKKRKNKLESDIHDSVSKLLKDFRDDTGISPSDVGIYTDNIQTLGIQGDELIITSVHCDINL